MASNAQPIADMLNRITAMMQSLATSRSGGGATGGSGAGSGAPSALAQQYAEAKQRMDEMHDAEMRARLAGDDKAMAYYEQQRAVRQLGEALAEQKRQEAEAAREQK